MFKIKHRHIKINDRIESENPAQSAICFSDFAKLTIANMPDIPESASVVDESANKTNTQCGRPVSKYCDKISVLIFINNPKGRLHNEIAREIMPQIRVLLPLNSTLAVSISTSTDFFADELESISAEKRLPLNSTLIFTPPF